MLFKEIIAVRPDNHMKHVKYKIQNDRLLKETMHTVTMDFKGFVWILNWVFQIELVQKTSYTVTLKPMFTKFGRSGSYG
jgi:hypothetical protein